MTAVEVHYNCGCGAKGSSKHMMAWITIVEEAIMHTEKTGHTVIVNGTIRKGG